MTRKSHSARPPQPPPARSRWTARGISLFLTALVFLVFGQTVNHQFVNYDDEPYVYENTTVTQGLSLENLGRAFNRIHAGNWHPLTTLSHMLDCQLFGLNPAGHHLHNVLLHAAASVLLFLMLRELTGATWRSAFVAALFAIHPLRVESVAWVSERKDVLSGVFFMLTLWAYARYAHNPNSKKHYAATLLCFALGLMSKPMLVTVPFVLLLLDVWPLSRWQDLSGLPALLREKIPFFVLALLSCVATVMAQREAIQALEQFPFSFRLENAVVAYAVYLGKWLWPADLAVLYPMVSNGWSSLQLIASLLLLLALSCGVFLLRRSRPFLLVGWLWFLGMMVPVIGILQVGMQACADRYTYLPLIGLGIAVTWLAVESTAPWRHRTLWLGGFAALVLAALVLAAYNQTTHWRDNDALWTHTLACTDDNSTAHYNLGNDLGNRDLNQEAMAHYLEAIRINPAYSAAYYNLGNCYRKLGRMNDAAASYREALRYNPAIAEAHNNLGNILYIQGSVEEAIAHIGKSLELRPNYAGSQWNLAWILATAQKPSLRDGARAVKLARQADSATADRNPLNYRILAAACAEAGDFPQAIEAARKALAFAEKQPDPALVAKLRREIKLYETGHSFRSDP